MSENKECLFYIDHNPPECSGTWGGAIYKGACKLNSTFCNDTDKCFIKLLYQQVEQKERECERLKWYLKEIRDEELKTLDIEWDEYETHCIDTEYTNIINLVEEALEERSPEDCRYKKDE